MRRHRQGRSANNRDLADEDGQPITFATPGAPTPEECRRYALAVQRATTPPALTSEQQAEVDAIHKRRRELFPETVDW